MKTLATINPEGVAAKDTRKFKLRETARAVVLDERGHAALLYVAERNYHKLPGGAFRSSALKGLHRECFEETGCAIKVVGKLGKVVEYRPQACLVQVSYSYLAKVQGEKGEPHFSDSELESGFQLKWIVPRRAKLLIERDQPINSEGIGYVAPRELAILRAAMERL
jgi:ADP-ribose pyrophosphatase YjhB (NUDIX family)